VTKQWSPNNNDIHEEPASSTQADKHQSQDKNSVQMQQPQEMLLVKWQNESAMSKETQQNSSFWNLGQLQNKNHGEQVQSLSKQEVSSLLSPCNTESSFCNHQTENLQSINKRSNLRLSPVQKLSVMHQAQKNPQSPNYKQDLMRNATHNNLETNQNQSDDHLRHEGAAEVTHRVSKTSKTVLTSDTFQTELKARTQTRHACAYYSPGSVHPVPCGKTMTS